jgi:hypothetical protein
MRDYSNGIFTFVLMNRYMRISFAICFVIFFMVSCDKDKFSDKPILKLKSISPSPEVPVGATLIFTLEYTDAQGDLAGVPVGIEKISSLSQYCPGQALDPAFIEPSLFTISDDLPPSSNQKGEIVITLVPSLYKGGIRCFESQKSEEAVFKFWITDLAGNESDTLVLDPITILKE